MWSSRLTPCGLPLTSITSCFSQATGISAVWLPLCRNRASASVWCLASSHSRQWLPTNSGGKPVGHEGSGRIERTDGDVVPVRISERKFHGSSVGIHMRLFFQPADESARPWQSYVEVVDPEEQEEAVARLGVVGDLSTGDARGHPTRGDRAGPFHPSRGFGRSRRGREPSPAGQAATGTT